MRLPVKPRTVNGRLKGTLSTQPQRQAERCVDGYRRDLGAMEAGRMAESQLTELQNMRVLLEEARTLARDLAYHRRARMEATIGQALDEVDRQIVDLRSDRA